MSDITDLRDTIIPKSDQLNADALLPGPMTITVTSVSRGSADQPVVIGYAGDDGRPYKPCKSMRKVLIFAWGENGQDWIGKSMTLYNKPDVKWGGVAVGGIRISHLSDIQSDIQLSLAETKGKKAPVIIKRLTVSKPQPESQQIDISAAMETLRAAASGGMDALKSAWTALPKDMQRAIGGCPDVLKQAAQAADEAAAPATTEEDGF